MCGIAGELRFDGTAVNRENLIRMRDTLIHRGPDGEGDFISRQKEVGLAHRRLSIIDLSPTAAQPMSSTDETIWITFNGEIYNHVELRRELQTLGHDQWKTTHSDTEVIVQAYQQWGEACLQKLRGMFAFAIWDARKNQLFIARDRLGIKPLYYYIDKNRFLFGSEIKAILAAGGVERKVNEESLFHFLTFATTPAPHTLFHNIFKLPAAHAATVTVQGLTTPRRYWDVWDNTEDLHALSQDQIGERVLQELESSVQLHKASDVPVGVFLSGGVDSTVNTLLFAKGEAEPVNTFTIDYDSKMTVHRSEVEFAMLVAKKAGAKTHIRRLHEKDLLEFLPQMIRLQDEPFADPVCMPLYYVSKLARDSNIKVCQLGEGADEIFCGYANWMTHYRIDRWRERLKPAALRELALLGLRTMGKKKTFTYEATRRAFHGELQFWAGAEAFSVQHKMHLLSPRLREKFKGVSSQDVIHPIRQRFLERTPDPSIINWMAYVDLNIRLPETLLMRVDKMGMGAGVESRVPFLDHKFVELAMSIPPHHKVAHGRTKHILKHAVRHIVPEGILRRTKQGFSVPLEDWFFSDLGQLMHHELKNFCHETDFLDWTEVAKLFEERKALQCWFLLNVALWWQNWIK